MQLVEAISMPEMDLDTIRAQLQPETIPIEQEEQQPLNDRY